MMTVDDAFLGILVALAAGILIGLERQQDLGLERKTGMGAYEPSLSFLWGGLICFGRPSSWGWTAVVTLVIISLLLVVAYFRAWPRRAYPGVITPLAAVIAFLLGVFALLPTLPLPTTHRYLMVIGCAGVVIALLSLKERLHRAIQQISGQNIYATAKFVILALVVLPLLPNQTYGPLDVLNPFHIGFMVVLIAGLSFLGYVCRRIMGPNKGLATTGILGSFVSSIAVTLSMSREARNRPQLTLPGSIAILSAASMMFV